MVNEINNETIGFSTLFRLLSSLEHKENAQIKNILLEILYMCNNTSFNKAIIKSKEKVSQLEDGGNDLFLFGIGYKITKKVINSEITV